MTAGKHITILILFMPLASKAQHTTQHFNVIWAGYNNTIRFNKKWSLVSDAQLRTKDWAAQWMLYDVRSGLSYNINEQVAVTGGFALFRNAQYVVGSQHFFKNEWRPWEEISYQLKLNKINLLQRLRTEQRFIQEVVNNKKTENYQYIFRLRYRFEWQFPLNENASLLFGNEIMVNPGYINNTLFFDQNRTYAGINFRFNSKNNLQCQYIKIFQWHSNTTVLDDQNVIRVNFIQQFNFSQNKKSK